MPNFQGPKTPSNQQVLRLLIFLVAAGNLLFEAAKMVVTEVPQKHPTSVAKSPPRLVDDVLHLYKETRLKYIEKQIIIIIVVIFVFSCEIATL